MLAHNSNTQNYGDFNKYVTGHSNNGNSIKY